MKVSYPSVWLVSSLSVLIASPVFAADDLQILKNQMATMQKRIAELEAQQTTVANVTEKSSKKASDWNANSKALKLYGQLRLSVDHKSGDGAKTTGTGIESNASRIGIKGSLPSGLGDAQLIYQAELEYDGVNEKSANNPVEFREGFAGLKSKQLGTVKLGRLSTGYKKSLTKIDPWNDNAPQSRSGGRQGSSELHSNYFNQALSYETPKIGSGTHMNLWYATTGDSTSRLHNTGTLKHLKGGNASGAGISYNNKKVRLSADVIDINADDTSGKAGLENGNGWQIAGKYKIGKVAFAALYEDVEDIGLGKNTYVNTRYAINAKTSLIAAYGQNRDGAVYGNKDWNNWSIGIKRKVHKKSEFFAAYNSRQDDTKNKDDNTFTAGMNVKFGY